ncbi:glycosyltransferase [Clostridium sp. 'White wine YQ']|uniref:glycosyltransferase n=1 Tax=Clostridium sp. 'White wine YQ' TaxID=3027474 RepID=UPI002366ED72|nr:glycosyltransferase [Clostridium sp. 'White wine YQ']MDD7792755.1 glycosyltransferase [Clostridium sp. 'White wine YQ']
MDEIISVKKIIDVSLISTVYNEEKGIDSFFYSVLNMSVLPREIIIVDAGSKDGTLEKLESYSKKYNFVKILVEKGCNIAQGRNIAINACKCDIIAVTDAGCDIDKIWLEKIAEPFQSKEIDVVSGWYEPKIYNKFQELTSNILFTKVEFVNEETFLPSSRSIAFRKSAWKSVGGYPEHLSFAGEDTLFDIRLKEKNNKFFFQKDAIVFWEPRKNLKQYIKQIYLYSIGDAEASNSEYDYLKKIVFYFIVLLGILGSLLYVEIGIFLLLLVVYKYRIALSKKNKLKLLFLYIFTELIQIAGYIKGKTNLNVIKKNKIYRSVE